MAGWLNLMLVSANMFQMFEEILGNPLQPINPINFEFRHQETIAISSDNDEEYENDYDDPVTAKSDNNAHSRKRREAKWSPDYDLYAQWAEEYYAEYETVELNQEKALLPKGDLLEQVVTFDKMHCDAKELAVETDISANFEVTQPRHRVRRENVNLNYEAQDDPMEYPKLKFKFLSKATANKTAEQIQKDIEWEIKKKNLLETGLVIGAWIIGIIILIIIFKIIVKKYFFKFFCDFCDVYRFREKTVNFVSTYEPGVYTHKNGEQEFYKPTEEELEALKETRKLMYSV